MDKPLLPKWHSTALHSHTKLTRSVGASERRRSLSSLIRSFTSRKTASFFATRSPVDATKTSIERSGEKGKGLRGAVVRGRLLDILRGSFGDYAETQLDTAVNWGRYAELFAFDDDSDELYLEQ